MKKQLLLASVVIVGFLAGLALLLEPGGCSTPPMADTATQSDPSSMPQTLPSAFEVHRIVIKENLAILQAIKDDQTELTSQQVKAIKILEVYRCEDAVPLLAKHVGKPRPYGEEVRFSNENKNLMSVSFLDDPASCALIKIGMPTIRYITSRLNSSSNEPISRTQLAFFAKIANEILPHFREYFQTERLYAPLEAEKTYDKFIGCITVYLAPPDKKTPTTMPQK